MRPDDDMIPDLQRLGEQLHNAARRDIHAERHSTRRGPRSILITALACLLATSAVAGAAVLLATGPLLRDHPGMPPELKPATPSRTPVVVTAPDPTDPGQWGARIYTSRSGDDCVVAGWLHNSVLGRIERGVFRPFADNVTGACGDLKRGGFFLSLTVTSEPASRTLVYGRAPDHDTAIEITVDGSTRAVDPGPGGAFLFVLNGEHTLAELRPRARPNAHPQRQRRP